MEFDADTFRVAGSTKVISHRAESILGFSINFDGKEEAVNIYDTDATGVRAFALSYGPGYFVLKNSTYRALFQNVASLDRGVIDKSLLDSGFNLNGTTISHATQFNGGSDPDPDPVPVPGTLLLLGFGLMGLRFVSKKAR